MFPTVDTASFLACVHLEHAKYVILRNANFGSVYMRLYTIVSTID